MFRRLVWTAVVSLTLLACAAPGAGDGSRPASDGQPRYGGVINMRAEIDPYDFDLTSGGKTADDVLLVLESLLGYEVGASVDYMEKAFRPELAERWEVSPDARAYTFHLRRGARFHDVAPVNGREVTSADVKWTFEYYSRTGEFKEKKLPAGQFEWMLEGLDRIETPDAHTAVVRFKEAFVPFLSYVAHDYTGIVAREVYQADGHLKDRIIGTGAFYLDTAASQKGSRWVMKKNPNYWMPDRPYLDEVRALVIADEGAAKAAFQTKQLDWIGRSLTVQAGQEVQRGTPSAVPFKYYRASPLHLYINHRQPPLDDIRVRQAISLALDPDEYIRTLADGEGGWALAGAVAGIFSEAEAKQVVLHDPDQARRLLQQAGYGGGLTIPFEFPIDRGQERITWFELFQAQMKKVGITVEGRPMAYSDYSNQRKAGKHTLNIQSKDVVADVDSYIYGVFYPNNRNNYDGVNDPDLTKLLDAQRREIDEEKRLQLIKQAVRMVNGEKYLGRAIHFGAEYQFTHAYVKNFGVNFYQGAGWDVLVQTWLER